MKMKFAKTNYKNPCQKNITLVDGTIVKKDKFKFNTLEEAISHAIQINLTTDLTANTRKVTAYKCKTCMKFHVGHNMTILTKKEVERLKILHGK
jgi:hypothetical protein